MRNIWLTRLTTLLLWLLAAGGGMYWLLQTTAKAKPHPAMATAKLAQSQQRFQDNDASLISRGLGSLSAPQQSPVAGSFSPSGSGGGAWQAARFQLAGILAQGTGNNGLVMLKVDGKPAELLRLGAEVEPKVIVQAINRQSVTLAYMAQPDAPQLLTLELGKKGDGSPTNTSKPSSASAAPYTPPSSAAAIQPPPAQADAAATAQNAAPNDASSNTDTAPKEEAATPNLNSDEARSRFAERMNRRRAERAAQDASAPNTPAAPAAQSAPSTAQAPATAPSSNASNDRPRPTPQPDLIRQSRMGDEKLYFN